MTRLFSILLVIFTLGSVSSLHAQADNKPPYLYYYSSLLGGLIIERADGTDSRHIAADVIPPNMTGLSGPGWSPSGKYFAGSGSIYLSYATYRQQPYIIDLKGNNIVPWLDLIATTSFMQWSPTGEDILLIVGNRSFSRDINLGTFFWLIDVEHGGKLLADFGANFSYFTSDLSAITWDTAHQQIYFYLAPEAVSEADRQHYRVALRFDGTTLREPVSADAFTPLEQSMDLDANDFIYQGDKTSPSGAYHISGSYIATLTNTHNEQTVELPLHTGGTSCHDYLWTEDEQYIISFTGTVIAGGGCGGALLALTDSQGKLWREIGGCVWFEPACVGWLPKAVNPNDPSFPLPSSEPVQLDPVAIEYDRDKAIYGFTPDRLSPLEFHCIDPTTGAIYDRQTYQVIYSLANMKCPYDHYASGSDKIAIPMVAAVDPVHHLLATFTESEIGTAIWKLNGRQYEPFTKLYTQGYILEFTADHEQLRARNVNGWKIYAIADILAAASTPK